jgi:hypothetical protein
MGLRRITAALAAIGVAALLAGCAGDGDATEAASGTKMASQGDVATEQQGEAPTAAKDEARVLPGGPAIVYRGRIAVRVKNVTNAAQRAEEIAADAGGHVVAEESSTDPRDPRWGQVNQTLRVLPEEFGDTLRALSALGTEIRRTRSSDDVTTQMADVDGRLRTQERSVARVRELLDEAASISDVVALESELTRREADLESLQAQLATLEDVTDMATIEVTLEARPGPVVVEDDSNLGFLSGLEGGWNALVGVLLVAITVIGAVLPFAAVVALVLVPAYLVLRRRQTPPAQSADSV